jgi:hypothetical protein
MFSMMKLQGLCAYIRRKGILRIGQVGQLDSHSRFPFVFDEYTTSRFIDASDQIFRVRKISHVKNVLTIYYPYINYLRIINIRDNWEDWKKRGSLFRRMAVR